MRWVWNLLRIRSALDLVVAAPIDEVVRRLRSRVLPTRPWTVSGRQGYAGEVTDQGFAVRRFGHALSRSESRPAVDVRGELRPEHAHTRVTVVMRHGRLLVTFMWLLLALALAGLGAAAGDTGRRPGEASPAAGAAVLAAFGSVWYLKLWWDLRRMRREVIALLTVGVAGGSPNQAL